MRLPYLVDKNRRLKIGAAQIVDSRFTPSLAGTLVLSARGTLAWWVSTIVSEALV